MIRTEGLSKDLGQFKLQEVSLEVEQGEYFVLIGPTGAGKTIFVECLAGLLQPDAGEIWLRERFVNHLRPEERNIGYVPQDYALFNHMTVRENIRFGLKAKKAPKAKIKEKEEELTELLGISNLLHRSPRTLSGGEQQRVALARALAIEPDVLLLDEPLSALDEGTREILCGELVRLHQQLGTTTVHICHNFEETLAVATKVGVINEGRLLQVGTSDEIFRFPRERFVAEFVRTRNVLPGRATLQDGGCTVQVGDLEFASSIAAEGEVFMTVRPEEIEVMADTPTELPANAVRGRITKIQQRGVLVEMTVDVGVPLVTAMLTKSFLAGGLTVGSEVHLYLDPGSINVVRMEGLQ